MQWARPCGGGSCPSALPQFIRKPATPILALKNAHYTSHLIAWASKRQLLSYSYVYAAIFDSYNLIAEVRAVHGILTAHPWACWRACICYNPWKGDVCQIHLEEFSSLCERDA